jgi:hypothetical protein|tara:strand:- start:6680 stop:7000 length:321 start_codon:yes stop_codon:yes gene_type:complete
MSVDTKYGEAIFKQTQEVAEMFKTAMPKITTNKNGYEIRTQVLEMAKSFTEFEYSNKWMGWEITSKRDPESGEIVSKVGMPQIPTTDHILEAAERFYDFVNGKPNK